MIELQNWTEKMTSVGSCLFLMVICVTGHSFTFVEVKCKSENHGQYGSWSMLECWCETKQMAKDAKISVITWTKDGDDKPLVVFNRGSTKLTPRFKFAEPSWNDNMNVSLLITDTTIADAGRYTCMVMTDSGDEEASADLTVTAKYNTPTIRSFPEKDVQPGTDIELFCDASGGYPEGRLHWFDMDSKEWPPSSELQVKRTHDGRFNLSSKLTLLSGSIFSNYKCSVYNATGGQEAETVFTVPLSPVTAGRMSDVPTRIVAPVVVIGSLIVGLLLSLMVFRLRSRQARRHSTAPLMSYRDHDAVHTDGGDAERGDQEGDKCSQDDKL